MVLSRSCALCYPNVVSPCNWPRTELSRESTHRSEWICEISDAGSGSLTNVGGRCCELQARATLFEAKGKKRQDVFGYHNRERMLFNPRPGTVYGQRGLVGEKRRESVGCGEEESGGGELKVRLRVERKALDGGRGGTRGGCRGRWVEERWRARGCERGREM